MTASITTKSTEELIYETVHAAVKSVVYGGFLYTCLGCKQDIEDIYSGVFKMTQAPLWPQIEGHPPFPNVPTIATSQGVIAPWKMGVGVVIVLGCVDNATKVTANVAVLGYRCLQRLGIA